MNQVKHNLHYTKVQKTNVKIRRKEKKIMDEILSRFKVVINGEKFVVWQIIITPSRIHCITPIPFVDFDNVCVDLFLNDELISDYRFSDFEVHEGSIVLNFEKPDI